MLKSVRVEEDYVQELGVKTLQVERYRQIADLLRHGRVKIGLVSSIEGIAPFDWPNWENVVIRDKPLREFTLYHYIHSRYREDVDRLANAGQDAGKRLDGTGNQPVYPDRRTGAGLQDLTGGGGVARLRLPGTPRFATSHTPPPTVTSRSLKYPVYLRHNDTPCRARRTGSWCLFVAGRGSCCRRQWFRIGRGKRYPAVSGSVHPEAAVCWPVFPEDEQHTVFRNSDSRSISPIRVPRAYGRFQRSGRRPCPVEALRGDT